MIEQNTNNNNIQIETTRSNIFNQNKNKLKAFSENLPKESELPSVPHSGGLFGWFDYDVKGSDLNNLTKIIQEKMIKQNEVLVRTIQEFNTIYDTFSALDKEYIQRILISLKAAEEANTKALKGISGVKSNQNDIREIINQQKQVIEILKKFKERIERIEHLADIDKIFDAVSTMQSNNKTIKVQLKDIGIIVTNLTNEMKTVLSLQSVFEGDLQHLKKEQKNQLEIIRELMLNQNENISKIEKESIENKTNIKTLIKTVEQNNSKFDVRLELTTNEVEKNKINFENTIKKINFEMKQQEESISTHLESELSSVKNEIIELTILVKRLSKMLKITQIILFTSICIICVLVILMIGGVI